MPVDASGLVSDYTRSFHRPLLAFATLGGLTGQNGTTDSLLLCEDGKL